MQCSILKTFIHPLLIPKADSVRGQEYASPVLIVRLRLKLLKELDRTDTKFETTPHNVRRGQETGMERGKACPHGQDPPIRPGLNFHSPQILNYVTRLDFTLHNRWASSCAIIISPCFAEPRRHVSGTEGRQRFIHSQVKTRRSGYMATVLDFSLLAV